MDLQCEFKDCTTTFHFSGHGRVPHFCHNHRKQINRENAARWHREHYRQKFDTGLDYSRESTIRPIGQSFRFTGPGLFEPLDELFNRAIRVKAHTLNLPTDYIRNFWIHGQAGQQFVKSFLHPDLW